MSLPAFLDLSGRTVLVTGAGSPTGIGFATARHLGALGAGVVLAATTSRVKERARELEEQGVEALGLVGDLTDPDVVADLVDAAAEWGDGLDLLVNNAGMVSTSQPDYLEGDLTATTPERWSESLRRNLDTAFLVTRAALPHLRVSGVGTGGHGRERHRCGDGDAGRGRVCRREGRVGRPHPGARGRRGRPRGHRQRGGAGLDRDGFADPGRGRRGAGHARRTLGVGGRGCRRPSPSSSAPAPRTPPVRCWSSTVATASPRNAHCLAECRAGPGWWVSAAASAGRRRGG